MKISRTLFNTCIYIVIFILVFSGIMLIYGSRIDNRYGFIMADFALKQFFIACAGFACMEYLRRIEFRRLEKMIKPMFLTALFLLYAVLAAGVKINGMRGWFDLGFIYFQPSDVLKCLYIFGIADFYERSENKEKAFFQTGFISIFWIGAILLQPDYGTAVIYGLIFAVISFLAGVKLYILALLPLCAVTSLAVFIGRKAYGFDRLYGFFSGNADISGSAWHWKQFQITIAEGGFFGKKIDGSFWSSNYLPFAYNDSAYAALHELTGFIGAALLLGLFFVLLYLFFNQAKYIVKGKLFVLSGISAIMLQTLLHCSVNCALVPTTGITMPLISYGGSSLLGTFLLLGMMLCAINSNAEPISDNHSIGFKN